jgi:hypothetical protein
MATTTTTTMMTSAFSLSFPHRLPLSVVFGFCFLNQFRNHFYSLRGFWKDSVLCFDFDLGLESYYNLGMVKKGMW